MPFDTLVFNSAAFLRRIKRRILPYGNEEEYESIVTSVVTKAEEYELQNSAYALANVKYYRERYAGLRKYPILTKSVVRQCFPDLLADDFARMKHRQNTSGGSTGNPILLLQDAEYDRYVAHAINYFYRELLGYDTRALKKLLIWGSEADLLNWAGDWKKQLVGVLRGTVYVNAFALSPRTLSLCVDTINSLKPDMIRGYANSLFTLSRYMRDKARRVHAPLFIVSSAERLTDTMRATIEEAFKTRVFDFYGSRECGAIAGECKQGNLHVLSFNHTVEVVNDVDMAVEPGERGRLIVTTLHNRVMPLLRYEIGDIAIKGGESCGCGNPLPTLKRIEGRISDNFLTKRGDIIHGEYFTHLFYFKSSVKHFQVIQEDFDWIRINLVVNGEFKEAEQEEITRRIRVVMGPECRISFAILPEMPLTAHGKSLFTLSKIGNAKTHKFT
jgi:phenylacetate-CoA ligase